MDYDWYWRTRPEVGVRKRHMLIADRIEPRSSVLELGCGDGIFLDYLKKLKPVAEEGIDLSPVAIEKARAKGLNVRTGDITQLDLGERIFDYIVAIEVLEHLAHPEAVLQSCKGCFRKNLVVTIPNTGYWRYRAQLLSGRFPKQWLYHTSEHLRYWTMRDFQDWTAEQGYQIEEAHSSKGIPHLEHLLPSFFSMSLVYFLKEANT